jgi:hypothetical protein
VPGTVVVLEVRGQVTEQRGRKEGWAAGWGVVMMRRIREREVGDVEFIWLYLNITLFDSKWKTELNTHD